MGVFIGPAQTPREISEICQLRYRVYVEELQIPTPEADHESRSIRDVVEKSSLSFGAWKNGEAIGSLRVTCLSDLPEPQKILSRLHMHPALAAFGIQSICTTSRFMLDPRNRNGRLIYPLMKVVYDYLRNRGIRLNFGDCSPHQLPFYQHLGFRNYERGFDDPAYGYKLPLLMLLGDRQELVRRRTPLARAAAHYPDDDEVVAWFQGTYPGASPALTGAELGPGGMRPRLEQKLGAKVASTCAIFRGMNDHDIDQILDQSTVFQICTGDRVARRGEPAKSTFLLIAGEATSVQGDRNFPVQPGDHFGQNGSFEKYRHSETVIADRPCLAVTIPAEVFGKMRRRAPAMAARLEKNLEQPLTAQRQRKNHFAAGTGA